MSIYEELKESGAELDNHYSDLYVKDSPEVRAIIYKHSAGPVSVFKSAIDGQTWIDIPFAYAPYWEAKQAAQVPA